MKIKICGIFRDCDIDFVNEACPDYIGFVFAKSRRQISAEQATVLRRKLDPQITAVGVFVDDDIPQINRMVAEKVIDIVQLHGGENEDYISRINAPIIKVVKIGDEIPQNADYILFDGAVAGSGNTFDWSQLPKTDKLFFLAGGINIENIDRAKKLNPYAIDISSGVETDGVKDKNKISEIVGTVKNG